MNWGLENVTARGEGRGSVGTATRRRAVQRSRPVRGRAGERPIGLRVRRPGHLRLRLVELVEAGARSGAHDEAAAALRRLEERTRGRHRLGARRPGPVTRAAERRRGCRRPLPRGDRATRAHSRSPSISPARTWCTASGCVARTGASTRASTFEPRTTCSATSGPRRSPSAPAASSRPPGETARRRTDDDARRPHTPGGADRPAGPGRPLQPRDRRATVHQPPNGAVPPAQGLREARDHLAQPAGPPRLPAALLSA